MSQTALPPAESLSVAFEPRQGTQESLVLPPDFSRFPIVQRILEKLSAPLRELGRRARRVGPGDGGTIVLLASCQRGAGCSTAALACAAATSTEFPTALVDVANPNSNSDSQSLTRLLVGQATVGWHEVVSGVAAYQDAVHEVDSREALAFIPKSEGQGIGFPTPEIGYSHASLAGWLGRLRQDYGIVFLDGGFVEAGAVQWAPWVDAVLIVCDPSRTADADWTRTWDRFEESGAHVLGIVETLV
jgi:Mrp family chromosome partitioning ATPase